MPNRLRRFIGTRQFYAMVLTIVIPIIVQNAITNFVNLLDNLMVGRIGTEEMSGVAIANQLFFVFNLTIFGAISGAGIFTSQFFGAKNEDGVRMSFRFKLIITALISVATSALFLLSGASLVRLYLTDVSDALRAQRTLDFAMRYLRIMVAGILPFALSQAYASTLRETGETLMPMYAGVLSVFVNLVFNYLLIFGKLGFPCLGVEGAAFATILSRYVEFAFVAVYAHTHSKKHPFMRGLYRSMRIPSGLARDITFKGMPLMANELLWSGGMAVLLQIYSLRGLDVVAAMNIANVINNLFSVAYLSMGSASAIIVGQSLGAGDYPGAKDNASKLMVFSMLVSLLFCLFLLLVSRWVPLLYNTTAAIQQLATKLICLHAVIMPISAMVNCAYFVLRSGGRTGVTFLFDCVFVWAVNIPVAYILVHCTALSISAVFLCVQLQEILKLSIGLVLIRKGIWINNLTAI